MAFYGKQRTTEKGETLARSRLITTQSCMKLTVAIGIQ